MMNPLTLRMIAFQVLIVLALALGALAWIARPEGALIWGVGMATLPVAWVGLHLFGAMPSAACPEQRRTVLNSLIGAGLLIAGALGASALGAMGTIPEDWITRYAMITNAMVLVVIGNGLPKKVEPGCSPTRGLAMQRLIGWTFVIGGIAQAICWLLVPAVDEALVVVTVAIYILMALAILIGIRRIRRGSVTQSPTA
ncbi:hypothetical protein [Halomonas denitrificans]|nr:hypothetical protein [Halomonas denitrificans]